MTKVECCVWIWKLRSDGASVSEIIDKVWRKAVACGLVKPKPKPQNTDALEWRCRFYGPIKHWVLLAQTLGIELLYLQWLMFKSPNLSPNNMLELYRAYGKDQERADGKRTCFEKALKQL